MEQIISEPTLPWLHLQQKIQAEADARLAADKKKMKAQVDFHAPNLCDKVPGRKTYNWALDWIAQNICKQIPQVVVGCLVIGLCGIRDLNSCKGMNSFKTTLLWDLLVCDLQHQKAGQSMNHLHLTESREGKESERKSRGGSWKSFGGSRKGAYWKSCTSNWYNIFLFSLLWNCVGFFNISYGPASYHKFWWTFKNKKSLLFFVNFAKKFHQNVTICSSTPNSCLFLKTQLFICCSRSKLHICC